MPLPRHSRSGARPHCSDANSVPVRPKPVATSSQISSTSCAAARGAEPREAVRVGELHAGRALHQRFDDHRRELAACALDHRDRDVEAVGRAELRRAQHREAQRIEDVGAEAAVADRQRADRVAVVGAAEREERRARRAEVRPVLQRDLQRLLDRGRAVGRVEEVRVLDRHDARERFRQLDDGAVAVAEHRRVRAEVELLRGSRRRARGRSARAS